MLNPLAQELNERLEDSVAGALLSEEGLRMYFPKGIIAQSEEAKKGASKANGTIGMTIIDGKPAILPSVQKSVPSLDARSLVAYAPTAGQKEFRTVWQKQIIDKNPLLKTKKISLPVVVPGLTAGISYIADLFIDEKKPLVAPDPSWDNYALITEARRGAELHRFNFFNGKKIDMAALENAVKKEAAACSSVRLLLNFPQNPSGYSPTKSEVVEICRIIRETASDGVKLLIICDDAYFGLNYENDIEEQSLFAHIADIHENVLAVKIDGPTKEDFAWGFRCGFVTFASKNFSDEHCDALVKKLMGVIRSSVSCSATPSQSLLMQSYTDPENEAQKIAFRKILEARYRAVRSFVDSHKSNAIETLPFNSGYFMSFRLNGIDAETLRKKLLSEKGIGTISIDSRTLRVAFSSIDEDKIESVYTDIYDTADGMYRAL
ncbi:aminotransferase class I/II-fold pyridoxal phosphate-dependent enzyme [Treponema sp. Marseille-Q4132]|uniref:aminotransferase class I/II-fold pyridoxal phosphate-dependent enzyme n=1 Tax=Treponema sp. Marseille-Q4132 TaxID=2766701 RepID=UPI001653027A|nr:aminotransferase class I/II-fold pyridoxal phosphate-dependent enzyme [Treponema sp. Marseille-Q4132]QNL98032.1 aminotransferase class I/II-fold pyridoxal phosphate-dependent enzyme [Treponema sp. Marseille-Q4132]